VTLINATRFLRAETPWRSGYHVIYAAYVGVAMESAVIDIEHWRHLYLILGALWGMMIASRPYLSNRSPEVLRRIGTPGPPMARPIQQIG
jgi:hypothetical protein